MGALSPSHLKILTTGVSLRLRAPKAPNANADMGTHHFTYAVMPHAGRCRRLQLSLYSSDNWTNPKTCSNRIIPGCCRHPERLQPQLPSEVNPVPPRCSPLERLFRQHRRRRPGDDQTGTPTERPRPLSRASPCKRAFLCWIGRGQGGGAGAPALRVPRQQRDGGAPDLPSSQGGLAVSRLPR